MKQVRRTVDELNELAEKITGANPKAKTDAQALNYIEQNYNGSNGLVDNLVIVSKDNSTIEYDDETGNYTITNEKLYNYVLGEENFKVLFCGTGEILDAYSISFGEENTDTGVWDICFLGFFPTIDNCQFVAKENNQVEITISSNTISIEE